MVKVLTKTIYWRFISLFVFTLVWESSYAEAATSCGNVTVEGLAIKGRYVKFVFIPYIPLGNGYELYWMVHLNNEWKTVTDNSSLHNTFEHEGSFVLDYKTTSSDKRVIVAVYPPSCTPLRHEKDLIELSLNKCGILYLETPLFKPGDDIRVRYIPHNSIKYNQDSFRQTWKVSNTNDTANSGYDLRAGTFKMVNTSRYDDLEYTLVIKSVDESKVGYYFLQCDDTRRTDKVGVFLPEKPSQPRFLDEKKINGSVLIGYRGYNKTITCETHGGTDPLVQIVVGQNKYDVKSRTGNYSQRVCLDESRHLEEVRCEVSNIVQESPLIAKSRLFVAVMPGRPDIQMGDLKEGHPINVTCSSQGGRPAPRLAFSIEGTEDPDIETSPLVTQDNVTSISLLHMKRSWNGKMLKCCTLSDIHQEQCSEKPINYQFPPDEVGVKQEIENGSIKTIYTSRATCYLTHFSAACSLTWEVDGEPRQYTYIEHLTISELSIKNYTHVVGINVSKADNGKQLTCVANCTGFQPKRSAGQIILVPYEPVVTLDTPSDVNITEGTSFFANCTVDSHPEANITWLHGSTQASPQEPCGPQSVCLRFDHVSSNHSGVYTCVAQSRLSKQQEQRLSIVVHRRSTAEEQTEDDQESKDYLVQVIAPLTVVAVFVCVIVVVVVKKRRSATDTKRPPERMTTRESCHGPDNAGNSRHGDPDGAACHAATTDSDTYAQPVPKPLRQKKVPDDNGKQINAQDGGDTYATPPPKSQRQQSASGATTLQASQATAEQELVYADLDLQTPAGGKSTGIPRRPANDEVEYVDIDFTKKANKLPDSDNEGEDKMYANQ